MRTAWSGADAHILGMRAACGKTVPLIMAAFADICGCATCGAVKLRGSRGWTTKRTPLCLWMADSGELNILGGLCMALFRRYCGYDRWDFNILTRGFKGCVPYISHLVGFNQRNLPYIRRDSGGDSGRMVCGRIFCLRGVCWTGRLPGFVSATWLDGVRGGQCKRILPKGNISSHIQGNTPIVKTFETNVPFLLDSLKTLEFSHF